jgi:hypothetical protein
MSWSVPSFAGSREVKEQMNQFSHVVSAVQNQPETARIQQALALASKAQRDYAQLNPDVYLYANEFIYTVPAFIENLKKLHKTGLEILSSDDRREFDQELTSLIQTFENIQTEGDTAYTHEQSRQYQNSGDALAIRRSLGLPATYPLPYPINPHRPQY